VITVVSHFHFLVEVYLLVVMGIVAIFEVLLLHIYDMIMVNHSAI
jgi:hypothetical protein